MTTSGSPAEDGEIVAFLLPHLASPCGEPGRKIQAKYLAEAGRLLNGPKPIQDAALRERLRIAMLFARIDGACDTRTPYDSLKADLQEAASILEQKLITDTVEHERCRVVLAMATILFS